MEDPRLSRMYAKLFRRTLAKRREQAWASARENRSTLLNLAAFVIILLFAVGYVAHLHGRFRRLKTELKAMGTKPVEAPLTPGGQEALVMQRTLLAEGTTPEFLSATLLPGRGMNVFQIMISVPGKGAIPLLEAPPIEDATKEMTGTGADAFGAASFRLGSPIEVPWAGVIADQVGGGNAGGLLLTNWHGRALQLPITQQMAGTNVSEGGLLLKTEADSVRRNILPDGGTVQGTFVPSNFGGHWPSQTSVAVSAFLSSRAFELKLVARNEGKEPVPVGLGWVPRLILPGGSRTGVRLRIPAAAREEFLNGRATGRFLPVSGTPFDFMDREGRVLRSMNLDETFVSLRAGFLDSGPVLEVRDPASGVGLRMTAMAPQIRALHLRSLAGESTMTVGFQTNLDDPFSRSWTSEDPVGINVLQPGQSLQWRVRLELFSLGKETVGPSL